MNKKILMILLCGVMIMCLITGCNKKSKKEKDESNNVGEVETQEPANNDSVSESAEVNKYVVSFDTDGGTSLEKQTVRENEKATKPSNPTKKGYVFDNWYLDDKKYDFNSNVTKDITLKAKWKKESTTTNKTETNKNNTNNTTENKEVSNEKSCTPKKFSPKNSYVYETMDICKAHGNTDFLDVSDNINSNIFAYGCKEIKDDCGDTWYGVIFYEYDHSLNTEVEKTY